LSFHLYDNSLVNPN